MMFTTLQSTTLRQAQSHLPDPTLIAKLRTMEINGTETKGDDGGTDDDLSACDQRGVPDELPVTRQEDWSQDDSSS